VVDEVRAALAQFRAQTLGPKLRPSEIVIGIDESAPVEDALHAYR
jgi:hypothetical protein